MWQLRQWGGLERLMKYLCIEGGEVVSLNSIVREPVGAMLVLFLLYVNVSEMRPRSRLFSQPFDDGFSSALGVLSPWLHPG